MIRPWSTLRYAVWITAEIVSGAVRIARTDLRGPGDLSPAVLELPLRCRTDLEITLMASSITITPGTLTVGIAPGAPDRPATLFVHALYAADPDAVRAGLRDMEDRLLRMTRGASGAAEAREEGR